MKFPPRLGSKEWSLITERGGGDYKTGGEEASDVLPLQKGGGGRQSFSQAGAGAQKVVR